MQISRNSKKYNQQLQLCTKFKIVLLIILYFQLGMSFEFRAASIQVSPETINTISQYTFTMNRQWTNTLEATSWNTEPVPLDADIIVEFPSEYKLTGN